MGPPCMNYRRSRGLRVPRVLFLCGKFSGFDTPIRLAGDVDRQRRVLQPILDGVEDNGVARAQQAVTEPLLKTAQ
jgi:hypothetical protein